MSGIAVLIISHNSDDGILGLIERAVKSADQVIVVDNGSTDQTVPLIRGVSKENPEVIVLTNKAAWWPNNSQMWSPLAAARNFGLTYVTKEWVLVLDDDEYVTPAGFHELHRLVTQSTCLAYFLPWNTYNDHGKALVNDYKLSFFRTGKGVLYDGLFHENATKSVRRLRATCGISTTEIVHSPSTRVLGKRKVYLDELTTAVRLDPRCARLRWFLGLTLFHLGEHAEAHSHLKMAGELDVDRWHPIERINACFLLGSSSAVTREVQQRRRWLETALYLCDGAQNDVEMLVYCHIVEWIRKAYEALPLGEESNFKYPSHLFYCF